MDPASSSPSVPPLSSFPRLSLPALVGCTAAALLVGGGITLWRHPFTRMVRSGWRRWHDMTPEQREQELAELRGEKRGEKQEQQKEPAAAIAPPAGVSVAASSSLPSLPQLPSSFTSPSSSPPLLLLPLDGLLVDTASVWRDLLTQAAQELFGLEGMNQEGDGPQGQYGLEECYERLNERASEQSAAPVTFATFSSYLHFHFADFLPFLQLLPGSKEVFSELTAGAASSRCQVAFLTNWPPRIAQLILETVGLQQLLSVAKASSSEELPAAPSHPTPPLPVFCADMQVSGAETHSVAADSPLGVLLQSHPAASAATAASPLQLRALPQRDLLLYACQRMGGKLEGESDSAVSSSTTTSSSPSSLSSLSSPSASRCLLVCCSPLELAAAQRARCFSVGVGIEGAELCLEESAQLLPLLQQITKQQTAETTAEPAGSL